MPAKPRQKMESKVATQIKLGSPILIASEQSSLPLPPPPPPRREKIVPVTFIGARKSRADPGEMECGPFNPPPPPPKNRNALGNGDEQTAQPVRASIQSTFVSR